MHCKVIDAYGIVQKAYFRRRRIYLKTTAKENKFFKRTFSIKRDCYVYITAQDEKNCKCETKKKKKSCHRLVEKVGLKDKKFSMTFSSKAEAEYTFLKENDLSLSSALDSCRKMRISFDEYMESYMRKKKAQKNVRKRYGKINFELKTPLSVEEINSSEDKSTLPSKDIVEEIHPSSSFTPLMGKKNSEELKVPLSEDKIDFSESTFETTFFLVEKEIHPFSNELNSQTDMLSTNPLLEGEIQDTYNLSCTADSRNNFICPDNGNAVESLNYINCKDVGPSVDATSPNTMDYTEFLNADENVQESPIDTIPIQISDVVEQCSEILEKKNCVESVSPPEDYVCASSPSASVCDIFNTVDKMLEFISETATDKPDESGVEIILPFVRATQIIRFNESEFNHFENIEPPPFHEDNDVFSNKIVETHKNVFMTVSVNPPGENAVGFVIAHLQNYNPVVELSSDETYMAKKELTNKTCLHAVNEELKENLSNDSETEIVDSIASDTNSQDDSTLQQFEAPDSNADVPEDPVIQYDNVNFSDVDMPEERLEGSIPYDEVHFISLFDNFHV